MTKGQATEKKRSGGFREEKFTGSTPGESLKVSVDGEGCCHFSVGEWSVSLGRESVKRLLEFLVPTLGSLDCTCDRAIRFELDRAGIEQRERNAVELVELRRFRQEIARVVEAHCVR